MMSILTDNVSIRPTTVNANSSTVPTTTSPSSSYELPFTNIDVTISAAILIPLSVIGLFENVITIWVIIWSPKLKFNFHAIQQMLKNVFNCLLISLSVSDFISALISPFFLYRRTWGFDNWAISSFMCKILWGLDLWTAFVTSIHILVFALVRYFSLKSPKLYYKISFRMIKSVIFVVWLFFLFVGFIPFTLIFNAQARDRQGNSVDSKWPTCTIDPLWLTTFKQFTAVTYSLFFYIPFVLVFVLSVATMLLIRRVREKRQKLKSGAFRASREKTLESKRRRKEQQAMIQLVLVVGSFFLGYIPQTNTKTSYIAYHFFSTTFKPLNQNDRRIDWWLGTGAYICLRVSECLNPVFYNLASSEMRKETMKFLTRCCKCAQYKDSETSEKSTNLPTSLNTENVVDNVYNHLEV